MKLLTAYLSKGNIVTEPYYWSLRSAKQSNRGRGRGRRKGKPHLKLVKTQKELLGFKETTITENLQRDKVIFWVFSSKKYFNICRKEKDAQCNLKTFKGDFTDCEDWSFHSVFLGFFFLKNFLKFCKKDTTSVFHKDINVYTPAQQKRIDLQKDSPPIIYIFL